MEAERDKLKAEVERLRNELKARHTERDSILDDLKEKGLEVIRSRAALGAKNDGT
ncbi:MAG: hypothetical protein IMY75_01490 [Chloroflexi bacterium]|nr:hypothetical protein [Chloroflexota bacterium]